MVKMDENKLAQEEYSGTLHKTFKLQTNINTGSMVKN